MALTLIVEDGSGVAGANCYISRADTLTLLEARLNTSAFTSATTANQDAAIAHAASILDRMYQWNGYRAIVDQAMQWPRAFVPDPDAEQGNLNAFQLRSFANLPVYFDEDEIPDFIVEANAELALSLLQKDRFKNPDGEGMSSFTLVGVMSVDFDLATKIQPLPDYLLAKLSRYGTPLFGGSGVVKLTRA